MTQPNLQIRQPFMLCGRVEEKLEEVDITHNQEHHMKSKKWTSPETKQRYWG